MHSNLTQARVPEDRQQALLAVITHVILGVRNLASELTSEELFRLMDAIHNIPIYLRTGGDAMWDTVQWDMKNYDDRFHCEFLETGLTGFYVHALDQASNSGRID